MQLIKNFKRILLSTLPVVFFFCSGSDKITGTVDDTDTGISVYLPDSTPAVDAVIKFIPSTRSQTTGLTKQRAISSAAVAVVKTDSLGRFQVPALADSTYNIFMEKGDLKAFQGEVVITSQGNTVHDDTLRKTGSFSATVGLDPKDMHNVGSVAVQILGSDVQYLNPDKKGYFTFKDIAPGSYKLRLETSLPEYSPTYFTMMIKSVVDSIYPDTIYIKYNGIPSVHGLSAQFDTSSGIVKLSWDSTEYSNILDYVVFRDAEPTVTYSEVPYKATSATALVDTIFDINKTPVDTQTLGFKYRVAIRNNSTLIGNTFGAVSVTATPFRPQLIISAGSNQTVDISSEVLLSGKIISSKFPVISREWNIGNSTWVLGGDSVQFRTNNKFSMEKIQCFFRVTDSMGNTVIDTVYITKTPYIDTLSKFPSPIDPYILHQYSSIPLIKKIDSPNEFLFFGHVSNGMYGIWSTTDFKNYTLLSASTGITNPGYFFVFQKNYYIYNIITENTNAKSYKSSDAISWSEIKPELHSRDTSDTSTILFFPQKDKLYFIGHKYIQSGYESKFWYLLYRSNDGIIWDSIASNLPQEYPNSFFSIDGSLCLVTTSNKYYKSIDDGTTWNSDKFWDYDCDIYRDNFFRAGYSDSVAIVSYNDRPSQINRMAMHKNGSWEILPTEPLKNFTDNTLFPLVFGNKCIVIVNPFSNNYIVESFTLY